MKSRYSSLALPLAFSPEGNSSLMRPAKEEVDICRKPLTTSPLNRCSVNRYIPFTALYSRKDTSDVERCRYSTSCPSVKAIAMIFRSEEHIMDSTTEPDCTIRASPGCKRELVGESVDILLCLPVRDIRGEGPVIIQIVIQECCPSHSHAWLPNIRSYLSGSNPHTF